MPKLGTFEGAQKTALEEAKKIAVAMKKDTDNNDIKTALDKGQIPEIVALIAYLNSLK
jgi:cytochrome c oxidase cbb3-type subunit 2